MDLVSSTLSGLIIVLVSTILGYFAGQRGGIKERTCAERQRSCQALLFEKISNVEEKIDHLTKLVNGKLFNS